MWQIGLIAYRLICWYVLPCGKACWGGSVVWRHVAQAEWGGPVIACHVALWWAHLSVTCAKVGPTCWHGPMGGCHVALGCWAGPIWCCHVAHPLSSSVLYLLCSLYPVCTQDYGYPQVAPRVLLIKSQPLINPFNLFYLLWIYFNSSTYPKIMKISPKIPKFMMIIPVIFNSIFTPVSLN
jgi:hypothetical protein